jgi:gas vesicle protein
MKISDIGNVTKEDLLASVGLATKQTTTDRLLSAFGFFGIGVVVGAAAALLIAPKSGQGLREDIGERLRRVTKRDGQDTGKDDDSDASSSSEPARA